MREPRIVLTGGGGFVGRHVAPLVERVNSYYKTGDHKKSLICLNWAGLPNYESWDHYQNIDIVLGIVMEAVRSGCTDVTIAGTCLERVDNPPNYALAKIELMKRLERRLPENVALKWVRLFYLYGPGQREECLMPSLKRAIERGDKRFRVVDAARDFTSVTSVAQHLVKIAMQNKVKGIIDCCRGHAIPVADFCRSKFPDSNIELIPDYPLPWYEPKVIVGNPALLYSIYDLPENR